MGKNVTVFGADMQSPVRVVNKNKDLLIFAEVPTQGLEDATLSRSKISF